MWNDIVVPHHVFHCSIVGSLQYFLLNQLGISLALTSIESILLV
ncbi:hypothetical protein J2X77_000189 [Sphingobacterium sp. 2149]|nr:hypothetical protein [Sphingobacterium sp. 2149]